MFIFFNFSKLFPPNHLVDNPCVPLDDFHYLCGDVLFYVIGYGDAIVAILVHRDGGINSLQETVLINAGDEETSFVESLGTLRAGADADGREGMTDRGEE